MVGSALFIGSGKIVRGEEVARAACGINTATPILASKVLGKVVTTFGPARRVALRDAHNLRLYDIAPDGILLTAAYATLDDKSELLGVPVAVQRSLPEEDIFTVESLTKIVTPAAFQRAPS
ncbi:MAG: hypothetical protein LH610_13185 [Sphingomonas bacterium]|nr:hypothetical protein [Sphingomonas bacterium]